MRLRAKRDATEAAIVAALERTGWTVVRLSMPDAPDLIVGRRGVTELIECKTGKKQPRANQRAWYRGWQGSKVIVMRSVEDVVGLNAEQSRRMEGSRSLVLRTDGEA